MELQTNKETQMRSKFNIGNLVIGLLIILIPIMIGALINRPELLEWIKTSWKEIAKAAVVGFSMLPVILFVTIKGGEGWYKKWWTWALIAIGVIAIFIISIVGVNSSSMGDMENMGGMNKMESRGDMGVKYMN